MVEFAFVLPVLLVFLFGILEYGLLLYNQHVITNASREGARLGILQDPRRTTEEIAAVVDHYTRNNMITFGSPNDPVITVPATCVNVGENLTVAVSYQYRFVLIRSVEHTLNAATIMKCE